MQMGVASRCTAGPDAPVLSRVRMALDVRSMRRPDLHGGAGKTGLARLIRQRWDAQSNLASMIRAPEAHIFVLRDSIRGAAIS